MMDCKLSFYADELLERHVLFSKWICSLGFPWLFLFFFIPFLFNENIKNLSIDVDLLLKNIARLLWTEQTELVLGTKLRR